MKRESSIEEEAKNKKKEDDKFSKIYKPSIVKLV